MRDCRLSSRIPMLYAHGVPIPSSLIPEATIIGVSSCHHPAGVSTPRCFSLFALHLTLDIVGAPHRLRVCVPDSKRCGIYKPPGLLVCPRGWAGAGVRARQEMWCGSAFGCDGQSEEDEEGHALLLSETLWSSAACAGAPHRDRTRPDSRQNGECTARHGVPSPATAAVVPRGVETRSSPRPRTVRGRASTMDALRFFRILGTPQSTRRAIVQFVTSVTVALNIEYVDEQKNISSSFCCG
ncbi:hypothetical protein B0H14DRAFT_207301 [Mycena olivaceomarginata]|nr:hypothetical protein B0H14DRAFT_207301 [Mycena olivaceomarginata]